MMPSELHHLLEGGGFDRPEGLKHVTGNFPVDEAVMEGTSPPKPCPKSLNLTIYSSTREVQVGVSCGLCDVGLLDHGLSGRSIG